MEESTTEVFYLVKIKNHIVASVLTSSGAFVAIIEVGFIE